MMVAANVFNAYTTMNTKCTKQLIVAKVLYWIGLTVEDICQAGKGEYLSPTDEGDLIANHSDVRNALKLQLLGW